MGDYLDLGELGVTGGKRVRVFGFRSRIGEDFRMREEMAARERGRGQSLVSKIE